jgi:dipeptidyl aminopeptidase/acylaminoacyl peptidase
MNAQDQPIHSQWFRVALTSVFFLWFTFATGCKKYFSIKNIEGTTNAPFSENIPPPEDDLPSILHLQDAVFPYKKESYSQSDYISSETTTPIFHPSPIPINKLPVIGGADKVALLNNNEIWIMNIDGSELVRLTNDGLAKSNLQWALDGEHITYLTGKCIQFININTHQINTLACFDFAKRVEAFEYSKDGQFVAIILEQRLFIIPNHPERIGQIRQWTDLNRLTQCAILSPYQQNGDIVEVKFVRWSNDGKRIAILKPGLEDNKDIINLLDISQCNKGLKRIDEFPSQRFQMNKNSSGGTIQNFAWDGENLFVMASDFRHDGFGNLWLYDASIHQADLINPIDRLCCYRDPQWSPDGRYLMFVYQNYHDNSKVNIYIYYIPFGTLGTGMKYAPLPLPINFFTNPEEKPTPILRLAK